MAEPIATFSGLASGIQWRDMIDEIMRLERQPAVQIQTRIGAVQARSAAWTTFQGLIQGFSDSVAGLASGDIFDRFVTSVGGAAGADTSSVRASAGSTASPGSYQVRALQLAQREKIGGDTVATRDTALGLSGEFLVNGQRVSVDASDSLDRIAAAINGANAAGGGVGASATVIASGSGGYRLVLTAAATGADGIELADGSGGVLSGLGLVGTSTSLKHATSDGMMGDGLASADTAVGTSLGLGTATQGTITLGSGASAINVAVDLSTQSLRDVADAINAASTANAQSGISAGIVSETVDGQTVYRLDISNTTAATDAGGVLEMLGVTERGDASRARSVQTGALLGGAATGATPLDALGAVTGETLTITATRGDGAAVPAFSFDINNAAALTLDDVVTAINQQLDPQPPDPSVRAATASVSADGRIVITDGTSGASQLALSIVANNENGGTLDFGTFDTGQEGYGSRLSAGADAIFEVDGARYMRASNTVDDVVDGLTLTLATVSEIAVDVTVERDDSAVKGAVQGMVDAYNAAVEFAASQVGSEGSRPPLSGNSTLRTMRSSLYAALQTTLAPGVAGDLTRLTDIGVEVDRNGRLTFDTSRLDAALDRDAGAVERLFGVTGSTSGGSVEYVGADEDTRPGTYDVLITQAATRASATSGANLVDGTYDGPATTLEITDDAAGSTYSVTLTAGLDGAALADRINAELQRPEAHAVRSSAALYSDAALTPVTEATPWNQVYGAGGTSAGVADGDVLTISGTRSDGSSVVTTYSITDAATQTVGELKTRIQDALGADVEVALAADGTFTVTAADTGSSLMTLSVSSDNAGGGSLQLGSFDVTTNGRSGADVTAVWDGATGSLSFEHDQYGSAAGFTVAYGDPAAETEIGIAAGAYAGQDVAGTIGGFAATGSGRTLTGDADTDVEGLALSYTGAGTGAAGNVTYTRGVAASAERIAERLLGSEEGSIQSLLDRLQLQVDGMTDRIDDIEGRLERREQLLISRFVAMEQALSMAQSQSAWLTSQLSSLSSNSAGGR